MYSQFFKLKQAPFSIAPDPRYLFMSERHREALAHLLYGIDGGGGFVVLTGEIGAGKTTIGRCFLEQIPANCNVAYIFNPKLTVNELLKSICEEFRIAVPSHDAATAKEYVDALNRYLLASYAEGRNSVLIIDEAQNLSADVLEQLRLLTNLETNERKLLQIMLIGQPELRAMLARPELEQLAQRVIARYHLESLSSQETGKYIVHRLAVAGLTSGSPFPQKLVRIIYRLTQGVPRRINLLCDRAMLGAYAEGQRKITRSIVAKAAREVFGGPQGIAPARRFPLRYVMLCLLGTVLFIGAAGWIMTDDRYGALISQGNKTSEAAQTLLAAVGVSAEPESSFNETQAAVPTLAVISAAEQLDELLGSAVPDEAGAYRELAKLWNVDLGDGQACQAAGKFQLRCYKSSNGIAEIRQLDRPSVVVLHDGQGRPHYAVLTGLTSVSATLQLDGKPRTVSLLALGRFFRGEFTTLWHAPDSVRTRLHVGDYGSDVDWLASQLAKVNGLEAPPANRQFDQVLARQVRKFQYAQGLEVDGVAGPKTFMHLNTVAGINEPRLQPAAAALGAVEK